MSRIDRRARTATGDEATVDGLVRAVEDGTMTREAFLGRAAALGLSMSAIGALLGTDAAAAAQRRAPVASKAATSTLKVADVGNGTADTLNPHKLVAPIDGMRLSGLYDKLVVHDQHWNPHPWLAESIEASKDAKTWTIRLVPNAHFHDGTPVTAADVQFTVNQILDPSVASLEAHIFSFMNGARAQILDSRTIRYHLKAPFANFVAAFGDPGGTHILPQNFNAATANTNPNGSGPFTLVSFTPGQESVMAKNPNYWNKGYPLVDQLIVQDIVDPTARINALISGEVDLATNLDYSQITTVKAGGAKVIAIPGNGMAPILLVPDVSPHTFKDPRVREAFAISIDRKEIIDVVYRGYATIGNDQPIGPTYLDHPVGIPVRKRNIAKAKQLLAAAGHPNGISATLVTTNGGPGMTEMATVVAQQVKPAGFHISIENWNPNTFWSDVWLKKDFYVSNWSTRPSAYGFLSQTLGTGALQNESHFNSPQVNKWLNQAYQTLSPKTDTKLYTEAMRAVSDSAQWIIPAYASIIHAGAPGFRWKGFQPPPVSGPDLWNAEVA